MPLKESHGPLPFLNTILFGQILQWGFIYRNANMIVNDIPTVSMIFMWLCLYRRRKSTAKMLNNEYPMRRKA